MKNKSYLSNPFSIKSWKETEKLSKMPQDKYEKAARSLTYRDELASMRPVLKPKAGEQDFGEYSNYIQKAKELKAGIKAGGDIEKQRKILSDQNIEDAYRAKYEFLKSQGALTTTLGDGNRWRPQSFEEFKAERKAIDDLENESRRDEVAQRYQHSLADEYQRASRGRIIAMRPAGAI